MGTVDPKRHGVTDKYDQEDVESRRMQHLEIVDIAVGVMRWSRPASYLVQQSVKQAWGLLKRGRGRHKWRHVLSADPMPQVKDLGPAAAAHDF